MRPDQVWRAVKQVTIIAAVSLDDGLALAGEIPWDEPADRAHFAGRTRGGTVIIGRRTWETLAGCLPGRENFVVTRQRLPGVRCFAKLDDAIDAASAAIWLIGGAQVYAEGYARAQAIELTRVPVTLGEDALRMPPIPKSEFEAMPPVSLTDAPHLKLERWTRRAR